MARRRMIDPNFWQSEDISRLSPFARLLFIGMISNADDEGRGRANINYLKSTIFPYDDIRVAEVDKALSEISHNTSVVVYEVAHSRYYAFTNWKKWQRVDKPQDSIIPPVPDNSKNDSGIIPESFSTDSVLKEKKRKEEKILPAPAREDTPSKKFIPPSLEQVQEYCAERKNNVDAGRFIDFYSSKGWMIGKNKMKDWKAAVRTWERGDQASPGTEPRLVDGGFEL